MRAHAHVIHFACPIEFVLVAAMEGHHIEYQCSIDELQRAHHLEKKQTTMCDFENGFLFNNQMIRVLNCNFLIYDTVTPKWELHVFSYKKSNTILITLSEGTYITQLFGNFLYLCMESLLCQNQYLQISLVDFSSFRLKSLCVISL